MSRVHALLVLLLLLLAPTLWAQSSVGPTHTVTEHEVREERVSLRGNLATPGTVNVYTPVGVEGRLPTVLIVHGYGMSRHEYRSVAEGLARQGFGAVLYEHLVSGDLNPQNWSAGVRGTLDALQALEGETVSRLDLKKVGLVGHSIGGATALITAARDARIQAVVVKSPGTHVSFHPTMLSAASRLQVPLLVIGAGNDAVTPSPLYGEEVYRQARRSSDRLFVEIKGANHYNFAEIPTFMKMMIPTEWIPGFNATISSAVQRGVAQKYSVAWMRRHLQGAADPAGLTDGRAAEAERERGVLSKVLTPHAGSGLPLPAVGPEARERASEAGLDAELRDALAERDGRLKTKTEGAEARGLADQVERRTRTRVRR